MTCAQHLAFKAATDNVSVGIVGAGVVGQALNEALVHAGFDTLVYDVNHTRRLHSLKSVVVNCKLIFVCVPTPSKKDGTLDLSYVEEAIQEINEIMQVWTNSNPVVLIKSTVTPLTTEKLQKKYPRLRLGCCPEFLRQDHAIEDALSPSRIVVGMCNQEDLKDVRPIIEELDSPKIVYTTPVNAELIKMLSNAFLSVKVAYANLIQVLCDRFNGDPETVYSGIIADKRIGKSHLDPTKGKMASDSPCLPKDLSALIQCADGEAKEFLRLAYGLAVEQNI